MIDKSRTWEMPVVTLVIAFYRRKRRKLEVSIDQSFTKIKKIMAGVLLNKAYRGQYQHH